MDDKYLAYTFTFAQMNTSDNNGWIYYFIIWNIICVGYKNSLADLM